MKKAITRRNFLRSAALGAAGVAVFPQLAGCKKTTTPEKDDTVRIGFIGLGQQSMYLLNGFIQIPGVEVLAGADVYGVKRKRFEKRVNNYYQNLPEEEKKAINVTVYEDYHEILNRGDINTVVIATPDHTHAFIAIDACKAKKDIYLEKPLTFTIKEGQALVKAVRDNDVILAVGSQQRSDPNFQHAIKIVQEGKIGKIKEVKAHVGAPPRPYDLPEQPIPSDLNWDMWLGPSEYVHYNAELNPVISLDPEENEKIWGGWRWYKELGGGFTTDWGAHMFDIAQWALKMDGNGPVEIIPAGYENTKFLTYIYADGTVMTEEAFNEARTQGCKFIGENGWIEVARDMFRASDDSLLPPVKTNEDENLAYETKPDHLSNFIDAVKKHIDPIVPVEIGHSTCTVCTLGNIAYDLMRPLKWNPQTQQFVDDPEANAKLTKTYARGYSI